MDEFFRAFPDTPETKAKIVTVLRRADIGELSWKEALQEIKDSGITLEIVAPEDMPNGVTWTDEGHVRSQGVP